MNPAITDFILGAPQWQAELHELRRILLAAGLEETIKWRNPCFTFGGKNVVMLARFKHYCALGFFRGNEMADASGQLISAGESSTVLRHLRFTSLLEILDQEREIEAHLASAILLERSGVKAVKREEQALPLPDELIARFERQPELETAFHALTPGRRRAYQIHFSQAKQAATREARIDKYAPRILLKKGIDDCVCGLSRRMPGCDGSHKYLDGNGDDMRLVNA